MRGRFAATSVSSISPLSDQHSTSKKTTELLPHGTLSGQAKRAISRWRGVDRNGDSICLFSRADGHPSVRFRLDWPEGETLPSIRVLKRRHWIVRPDWTIELF
jgi:hypothetical protein